MLISSLVAAGPVAVVIVVAVVVVVVVLVESGSSVQSAATASVLCHHARAGTPVVRQSCHHAMVSGDMQHER